MTKRPEKRQAPAKPPVPPRPPKKQAITRPRVKKQTRG